MPPTDSGVAACEAEVAKVLFTLQINVTELVGTGIGDDGVVTLTANSGVSPNVIADDFIANHSLPHASKPEIAASIMNYAKRNGFVSPIFSIPVQLPALSDASEGATPREAVASWFPGDQASIVAAQFAQEHGLRDDQRRQLLRALVAEARTRNLVSPVFTLEVELPDDKGVEKADVFDGDDLDEVARAFVEKHSLPEPATKLVRTGLTKKAKAAGVVRPVLEIGVKMLDGKREPLKLYAGENFMDAAVDFAFEHKLNNNERESLLAAVEEQGQKNGLLQPLLFKLPLRVGDPEAPMFTQVYVHAGDVPRELAAGAVRRYSGWQDPEGTIRQITEAILQKAKEINESKGFGADLSTA